MFRALVTAFCLPTAALAVEPCEGLINTAEVAAISQTTRQVAVRRAKESCTITATGAERRTIARYVELRAFDTGAVTRRFVPGARADAKALSAAVGAPLSSWNTYTRTLKEGRFQSPPPSLASTRCQVSLSIEGGGLAAIVAGTDRAGKPLRATVKLIDTVKPGTPAPAMARGWLLRDGRTLVFDIEAPVPEGHFSAVRVVTAKEAPVLEGCAAPRPTLKKAGQR